MGEHENCFHTLDMYTAATLEHSLNPPTSPAGPDHVPPHYPASPDPFALSPFCHRFATETPQPVPRKNAA